MGDTPKPSTFSVSRRNVVVFILGMDLFCVLGLLTLPDTGRALLTPWYLLILPGIALLLALEREMSRLAEFVLKSFVMSVLITFSIRTAVWYLKFDLQVFNWTIALWILGFLFISLAREGVKSHSGVSVCFFSRSELLAVFLATGVFAVASLVVLNSPYTPKPDELKYLLGAKSLNLFSTFSFLAPNKAYLVNFALSRPLWSTTISSFLAISSTPVLSSRVIEVFFLSLTMLATFMFSSYLASERVGLIAASLTFSTPALMIWSSTVLVDLAFATFSFLGYYFFIKSIRNERGARFGINLYPIVFGALSFLFALLTKPGHPIIFVVVYVGFSYVVWKSELGKRRHIFALLIGLPSAYLVIDLVYNVSTYVIPNSAIHNLILPLLPISFFERFFALFHHSAAFPIAISKVSALSLEQGMYLSILPPYLISYPIIFLFIAGIVSVIKKGEGIWRFNLILILSILIAGGLLSSLLLPNFDISRNSLIFYPFIICLASLGFYYSPRGRVMALLVACVLVLGAIYYLESTMLEQGGIVVDVLNTNQTKSSLLSIGLLLGLGILVWKAIQGSKVGTRLQEKHDIVFPHRSLVAATIGLIAIASVYQTIAIVQTSPVLARNSFDSFNNWLNSSVKDGDTILTNGNLTLDSLANDTLLQLIHNGGVSVLPIPTAQAVLINQTLNSSYQYLVIFKSYQYTFTGVYDEGDFVFTTVFSTLVIGSSLVDVYQPNAPAP